MVTTSKNRFFKKGKHALVLIAILIVVGVQFYRPNKNIQQDTVKFNDFLLHENAPENVAALIRNSCYDCHSDFTNYKWYDQVAPVSWFVDDHITEAKEHLNFSKWTITDYRDKRVHLSNIANALNNNTMPLPSYVLLHKNAKLLPKEKQQILDWLYTINIKNE